MKHFSAASTLHLLATIWLASAQCTDFYRIGGTSKLDDFDTIILDVEDDCLGGVDATFAVPTSINFKLYEVESSRDPFYVSTSSRDMIIPYVAQGALRFRWNPRRSDDIFSNTRAGIQVMFKSSVSTVQTGQGVSQNLLGNLDISIASYSLQQVINNGPRNTFSINHFGRNTLTYKTTGTFGSAEILCTDGNLEIDIGGEDMSAKLSAPQVKGEIHARRSDIETSGSTIVSITTLATTLTVDDVNGCDNVTQTAANYCLEADLLDLVPSSIPCLLVTSPRTLVCGAGSSATKAMNWGAGMLAFLCCISSCFVL